VGAYREDRDRLVRTAIARVEVQGAETPVDLPGGADLYLVNDDDLTFATTRPDAASRDRLVAAASRLPSTLSRGVAIATLWDMLVTGDATAAEAVHSLTAVLETETSESVIEPYLTLACDAAELWAPDVERDALTAAVAATCQSLAHDPDRRQVALRGLARTAGDLDQVARLQTEAGDDGDLQWRALVRKGQLGGETAADVERLLGRDPDPDAWVRALVVRAATPDAGEKAAVWRTLVEQRTVPIESVKQVTTAFWRPEQDHLLAPYAERYLELLPDLGRHGMMLAMVYTSRLFPTFAVDQAFVDRAGAAAGPATPVVRKTLLERADVARRMLRSRG
jgi:aminopeptidase N